MVRFKIQPLPKGHFRWCYTRVSEHLCMLVSLVKVATRRRAALIMLLWYHTHTTALMVSWYRLLLVTHSSCRAYAEDTEAMTMHAKPNRERNHRSRS